MKGWWRVDIDGVVYYQHSAHMADAVFGAMKVREHWEPGWDFEKSGTLIGVERCEVPEGKRKLNPRNWLTASV